MASKQKLNPEGIARALHQHNRKRFGVPIGKDEVLSFDELQPTPTCETCGNDLERDLFQNWACGFCGGWRVKKDTEKISNQNRKGNL
jgi:rubredoxin